MNSMRPMTVLLCATIPLWKAEALAQADDGATPATYSLSTERVIRLDVCDCADDYERLTGATRLALEQVSRQYDTMYNQQFSSRRDYEDMLLNVKMPAALFGPLASFIDHYDRRFLEHYEERTSTMRLRLLATSAQKVYGTGMLPSQKRLREDVDLLIGPDSPFAAIAEADRGPLRDAALRLIANRVDELASTTAVQGAELEELSEAHNALFSTVSDMDRRIRAAERGAQKAAAVIRNGPKLGVDDQDRRDLQADVARATVQAETIARQAGAVATIFDQLGDERGAKAAAFVSAAGSLVGAIGRSYLGDPSMLLPTIANVGSMFGRRPDPNAAVLQALRELSEQMVRNHAEILNRMDRMDYSVALTGELARAAAADDLPVCSLLDEPGMRVVGWARKGAQEELFDLALTPGFVGIAGVERFVQAAGLSNVSRCLGALERAYSPRGELVVFQSPLVDIAYISDNSVRSDLRTVVNRKQVWFSTLDSLLGKFIVRQNLLFSSVEPPLVMSDLSRQSGGEGRESAEARTSFLKSNFHRMISAPTIMGSAQYIYLTAPLFELLSSDRDRLWSQVELAEGAGSQNRTVLQIARRGEDLLNLAVVQESLWSGGALIPLLYDAYIGDRGRWDDQDDATYANLITATVDRNLANWRELTRGLAPLWEGSGIVAANIVRYDLYRNFQGSAEDYKFAQESDDLSYMRSFWRSSIRNLYVVPAGSRGDGAKANKWAVKVGDSAYELPSRSEFVMGQFLPTLNLPQLLEIRQAIRQEIVAQTLGKDGSLSTEQRLAVGMSALRPDLTSSP